MILEIYKSWIIVLVLHELTHIFFVFLFRGKIDKVVIGNFIFLHIKKVAISPIIINCSVSFEEGKNWGLWKQAFILLMPAAVNLTMGVLVGYDLLFIKIFSLFIGINSLLPMPYLQTDGFLMYEEIKKIYKTRKRGQ
ncbi:hypothetical protein C1903_09075 [Listeria ivanovii]|uniref:hypothetical protein n=1 Tax=Listeria ivanovii TaxID=1638 RepID=UPI000DA7CBB7|nr:hypothetical protein [Listeria ivanovii]PZF88613.1 hypothetical protein C1905_09230 [Listeria ivanovii]PZF93774.1 hypothetical protein C1903_09075 [Listeria ivanovii]PZG04605.1 hypothetical protein C2L88_08710 [Listeria ivanovii]PZG08988.1 hypothetical protein C1901_09065 [Listeria ivanovii]PZG25938.1 hypothetical protein C1900_09240 [Listeria ivanovii]